MLIPDLYSLTPTLPPNHLTSIPEAGRTLLKTSRGGAQEQTREVPRDQVAILEARVAVLEGVEDGLGPVEHQGGRWVLMM
jgi:hypothetical protein